jgi:hypothetical protein
MVSNYHAFWWNDTKLSFVSNSRFKQNESQNDIPSEFDFKTWWKSSHLTFLMCSTRFAPLKQINYVSSHLLCLLSPSQLYARKPQIYNLDERNGMVSSRMKSSQALAKWIMLVFLQPPLPTIAQRFCPTHSPYYHNPTKVNPHKAHSFDKSCKLFISSSDFGFNFTGAAFPLLLESELLWSSDSASRSG